MVGTLGAQFSETPVTIQSDEMRIGWGFTKKVLGALPRTVDSTRTVFTFKNLGDLPLRIEGVYPTCSCTVPKYSAEPVQPGEEGQVEALLELHNPGPFSKMIKVRFVGMAETVMLVLEGTILE